MPCVAQDEGFVEKVQRLVGRLDAQITGVTALAKGLFQNFEDANRNSINWKGQFRETKLGSDCRRKTLVGCISFVHSVRFPNFDTQRGNLPLRAPVQMYNCSLGVAVQRMAGTGPKEPSSASDGSAGIGECASSEEPVGKLPSLTDALRCAGFRDKRTANTWKKGTARRRDVFDISDDK